jgi:hypothetical protein
MQSACFTSPQRGEVELRSNSGEGAWQHRDRNPSPEAFGFDLSLRERWAPCLTLSVSEASTVLGMLSTLPQKIRLAADEQKLTGHMRSTCVASSEYFKQDEFELLVRVRWNSSLDRIGGMMQWMD